MESLIKGLHHITLVTRNYHVNSWFYTKILGLKQVKLSVNQDDIFHRHAFYANENKTVGSTITFFEWPFLDEGYAGLGSPHHLSYLVNSLEALIKWRSWLKYNNIPVSKIYYRFNSASIYFKDPDGVLIEIKVNLNEKLSDEYLNELMKDEKEIKQLSSDMKLIAFDHATPITNLEHESIRFFEKILGLKKNYELPNPDDPNTKILALGNDEKQDFIRYIYSDSAIEGYVGIGSIHHIAFAIEDESQQREIMKKLSSLGIRNSGIINRLWFKSLYFRDLNGNLLEIATVGPGYEVDEKPEELGTKLVLPPWLEKYRKEIESRLKEQDESNKAVFPPKFKNPPEPPEKL